MAKKHKRQKDPVLTDTESTTKTPVAAVGDVIDVDWPVANNDDDITTCLFKGVKIIDVVRTEKYKSKSFFKYLLQFESSGDTEAPLWSRLAHLNFTITQRSASSSTPDRTECEFTTEEIDKEGKIEKNRKKAKKNREIENISLSSPPLSPLPLLLSQSCRYICAPMVGGSELAFR